MSPLEACLCRHASACPDRLALVCGPVELSYAQLWQAVCRRMDSLSAAGLHAGEAWVCRASQSAEFLTTYLAVHALGGVMVPLEQSLPDAAFDEIRTAMRAASIPEGTADILFTTGTTGRSKGVMISHEAIRANAENLIEAQGFTSGLMFVISGPLNHIGSLSKVWPVIRTGGALCVLEGMKDLNAFYASLSRPGFRFATFLVPSAIRMLLAFSGGELSSYASVIDFIETGAAPIRQEDMEELCRVLPHSRLYNASASTETGIVCTHDFNRPGCRIAGCLGRPMKHARIRITPDGTVACQGPMLMTGYVDDPEQTASVLREGRVLFTHDKGEIDAEGRLHLIGRSDDVINVGGYKVDPSEVEAVAAGLPDVADCVCVRASHPVMGTVLKLLVVPAEGCVLDRKKIARHIRSRLELYKVPALYEAVQAVEYTYNGKINRKAYRDKHEG